MHSALKKILFLFTGIIFYSSLNAQDTKFYLKDCDDLDSLSNLFLNVGDNEFLVIDAYHDGLIKDNTYQFIYREGILQLNGKFLNEPYNTRYLAKLRAIESAMDEKPGSFVFTMGPGAPLGQQAYVYLPPFDRYKQHENITKGYLQKPPISNIKDSLLVVALIKDKMIYSGQTVHIRYNKLGVWVNGIQLSNVKCRKYIPTLERLTNIPAPDEKNAYAATDLSSYETKRYGSIHE